MYNGNSIKYKAKMQHNARSQQTPCRNARSAAGNGYRRVIDTVPSVLLNVVSITKSCSSSNAATMSSSTLIGRPGTAQQYGSRAGNTVSKINGPAANSLLKRDRGRTLFADAQQAGDGLDIQVVALGNLALEILRGQLLQEHAAVQGIFRRPDKHAEHCHRGAIRRPSMQLNYFMQVNQPQR